MTAAQTATGARPRDEVEVRAILWAQEYSAALAALVTVMPDKWMVERGMRVMLPSALNLWSRSPPFRSQRGRRVDVVDGATATFLGHHALRSSGWAPPAPGKLHSRRRCRLRLLLLPKPVLPLDGHVDRDWPKEGGADPDVQHAGAHDEDSTAEPVGLQQVLDEEGHGGAARGRPGDAEGVGDGAVSLEVSGGEDDAGRRGEADPETGEDAHGNEDELHGGRGGAERDAERADESPGERDHATVEPLAQRASDGRHDEGKGGHAGGDPGGEAHGRVGKHLQQLREYQTIGLDETGAPEDGEEGAQHHEPSVPAVRGNELALLAEVPLDRGIVALLDFVLLQGYRLCRTGNLVLPGRGELVLLRDVVEQLFETAVFVEARSRAGGADVARVPVVLLEHLGPGQRGDGVVPALVLAQHFVDVRVAGAGLALGAAAVSPATRNVRRDGRRRQSLEGGRRSDASRRRPRVGFRRHCGGRQHVRVTANRPQVCRRLRHRRGQLRQWWMGRWRLRRHLFQACRGRGRYSQFTSGSALDVYRHCRLFFVTEHRLACGGCYTLLTSRHFHSVSSVVPIKLASQVRR